MIYQIIIIFLMWQKSASIVILNVSEVVKVKKKKLLLSTRCLTSVHLISSCQRHAKQAVSQKMFVFEHK